MTTLDEIKHALGRLSLDDLDIVAGWLEELSTIPPGVYRVGEARPAYAPTQPAFMTIEEYFEFEEKSQLRHEYINGYVYAMSGVSIAHARITAELLVAFKTHLRGKPCEAFATDLKLRINPASDEIVYCPDLVVACNREEWAENYLINPKLVIEVLSPSTRHIDRREKAMNYRRVTSIEEYALLEQDQHSLMLCRRVEGWKPQMYTGPEAIAEFRSVALSVSLADIYSGTLPSQ